MQNFLTSSIPSRLDLALRLLDEPSYLVTISTLIVLAPKSVQVWWSDPFTLVRMLLPFITCISLNLLAYRAVFSISWRLRFPMLKVYYGGILAMMTFYLLWFVVPAYTSGLYCLGEGHCFTQRPMLFHDVWPGFRWEDGDSINMLGILPVMIIAPISSISVLLRALLRRRGGWVAILCAVLALVAIVAGYSFADDVISKYE